MIEIVMSVCLIREPANCRDVTLPTIAENATPYQCATFGQIEASKWFNEHPDYVLKKLKCGPAGQMAKADAS